MKSPVRRIEEIDALRGFAALAVMLFHYVNRYHVLFGHGGEWQIVTVSFLPQMYFGLIPVYVFFTISGFVIFMTVERSVTTSDFAFSRFSRLYPTYWTSVTLTGLALLFVPGIEGINRSIFLVNLSMLQEFMNVAHLDGVYWSLTVELSFYLLVLILKWTGFLESHRKLLFLWAVLCVAYGFFDKKVNPIPEPVVTLLILHQGQYFIAGIVFYRIWKLGRFEIGDVALILLSLVAVWLRHPLPVVLIIAAFDVVLYLIVIGRMRWLVNRVFVWLGTISYALYLLHQNVGYAIMQSLNFAPETEIAIAILAVLVLSSLVTYLVERPALRMLRNWWRSRKATICT